MALLFLAFSWALTQAAGAQVREQVMKQVDIAIMQIGQATQQNATLVEEAADVSRSLEAQASSLDGAVSAFKLTSDAQGA